jgi:hypothetical protein
MPPAVMPDLQSFARARSQTLGSDPSAMLAALWQHASQLNALQDCINEYLSPYLQTTPQVVSLHDGQLKLFAPHAAAASRLKTLKDDLIHHLNQHHWAISSITLKINPDFFRITTPRKPSQAATGLPEAGLQHFSALAQQVTEPTVLAAIQKLVQRHIT